MTPSLFSPAEVLQKNIESAKTKAALPIWKMLLLGVLAGAYIGFGAEASNMAAYSLLANPSTYGLGRVLAGAVFTVGLMLVVMCGAELFTGNCLMITGVLDKKVSIPQMLKNWLFVYAGNCLGGILVALLVAQSGLLGSGANQLAAMTIKIAVGKVNLSFGHALILGVLCNWLVCLAVWMATAATDVAGKILAIFFPIMLFVTSGFEHSVANMCYIPLGIFAKLNSVYADAAMQLGVTQAQLDGLGFSGMFANNLLPVTIGNILGGSILVACVYWAVYMKKQGK